MPRIVRFEATGPIRIDPQDKPVFVCACGISTKLPICDGRHKICKEEDPAKVYRYDPETGEVVEERNESSGD